MKVKSLYGQGKTVFSFEVFPPKKTTPIESIYATLDKLTALKPDYISVTYGAGGNLADKSTIELASTIKSPRTGRRPEITGRRRGNCSGLSGYCRRGCTLTIC